MMVFSSAYGQPVLDTEKVLQIHLEGFYPDSQEGAKPL